jgi:hypothetical protein
MSNSSVITASAAVFAFNANSSVGTNSFSASGTATASAYKVGSVTIDPVYSNDSIMLMAGLVLVGTSGSCTLNWWRSNSAGQTVVGFPYVFGGKSVTSATASEWFATWALALPMIDAPSVSTAITYNLYANVNAANTWSVSGYQLIASEVP